MLTLAYLSMLLRLSLIHTVHQHKNTQLFAKYIDSLTENHETGLKCCLLNAKVPRHRNEPNTSESVLGMEKAKDINERGCNWVNAV